MPPAFSTLANSGTVVPSVTSGSICWITALHRTKVERAVGVVERLAQVGHLHPVGNLGVKPSRLQDVLLHRVHTVYVVSILPVEVHVPRPCTATRVQPTGPWRDKLEDAIHEVPVAPEQGMGHIGIDRLDKIVAHLGIALRVSPVKGLGIIGSCAHRWTATIKGEESVAENVDELPGHSAGRPCRQVQRGLGHILRNNPVRISRGIVSPVPYRYPPSRD